MPVHADLRGLLQAWLDNRRSWPGAAVNPVLLLNIRDGRISDRPPTIITDLGDSAGITCGGEKSGPHVLRHMFATQLLRDGADLVLVAELLRPRPPGQRRLYTLPTADRAAAIDRLLTDH